MSKDYVKLASEILEGIGGKENINALEHCSTRLRFTLKDDSKADAEKVKKIDGVIGVATGVQFQVIIGNDVVEAYDEVIKLVGELDNSAPKEVQKKSGGAVVLDFIIGVFQPIVPAIAGGGILKSLIILLSSLGLVDSTSDTYTVLYLVGDAPLYFLPILVAVSTAAKLKVNIYVALTIAGALLLPGMSEFLASPEPSFLTLKVTNITYAYQVLPTILAILLYAPVEKYVTKYSPKPIRIFFVPMVSLLIVVPITLLILGPLGYTIGSVFASIIVAIYEKIGFIAVALLAVFLPFMVFTGMHKAMIPYAITSFSTLGYDPLYLPASLAHNISESGACFAVAIRTKNQSLRAVAISAGISALFGITEPALYGVTFQHKKVLYSVVLSSGIAGAVIGIFMVKAFVLVGPGIASLSLFIDPDNAKNILFALLGFVVAFIASFIFALVFYKDEVKQNSEKQTVELEKKEVTNA